MSIDLCLAKSNFDLTCDKTKQFWVDRMRAGQVLGVGGGPSCETWSAARHNPNGPPPVRSYEYPWGILGLKQRQWRQVQTGTCLVQFLVDLLLLAAELGLCVFLEHPAFPVWLMLARPASVWTLDSIRALAKLQCSQICSFDQCVYHLQAKMPTTLLLLRLGTFRDLTLQRGRGGKCAHLNGHPPLRGRNDNGEFTTACAKIYPKSMNYAIALAVSRFLSERLMSTGSNCLPEDFQELDSRNFVDESVIQPDFHQRSCNMHVTSARRAAMAN